VPVLSPDVNLSGSTFTPVLEGGTPTGHSSAQASGLSPSPSASIRFGLAAIKGVGEGAAEVIIEERENEGPYQSFRDFITRQSDKNVNRRVMEALIKTGAFDSFGTDRATLLHDLDAELAEAESLRRDREAGQANLFGDLLDMDAGVTAADKPDAGSKTQVPAMPMAEKLGYEKELLGFYISGHPMDAYAGLDLAIDTFQSPDELNNFDDRTSFRLAGIVSGLAIKYTRKDSRQMAVFQLATRNHSYEMIMFPDPYEKNGARLENGKLCLIHGLIGRRNGEMSLAAHEVYELESSIPKLIPRINFILHPNQQAARFIELLRETIEHEYGSTQVNISFLVDNQIIEAETAQSLTFTINSSNYKKLRRHPALAGVRIESVATPVIDDRRPWQKFSKAG